MKRITIFISLLISLFNTSAQEMLLQEANNFYEQRAYFYAVDSYNDLFSKSKNYDGIREKHIIEAKVNHAKSYRKINETIKAEGIYAELIHYYGYYDFQILWEYTTLLQINGKLEESIQYLKKIHSLFPNNTITKKHLKELKNLHDNKNSGQKPGYVTKKCSFNTTFSEFSPQFYKNGIVFSSNKGSLKNQYHRWIAKSFSDIYYYDITDDKIKPFPDIINSPLHEGSVCFTNDETGMYFTRNYYIEGKEKTRRGVNNLAIWSINDFYGTWDHMYLVEFNNYRYNFAHPSLIHEELMIFSSDMPGGYGEMDLYVSHKVEDEWQEPVNLGPEINTFKNELFPFAYNDSILYFTSDGHAGFGGLDIFKAKYNHFKQQCSDIENVKAPINSPKDDFAFIMRSDSGYFTTNRMGNDDIYAFSRLPVHPAKVTDKNTLSPVTFAYVEITQNKNDNSNDIYLSDSSGNLSVSFLKNKPCSFLVKKSGYKTTCHDYLPSQLKSLSKTDTIKLFIEKDIDIKKTIQGIITADKNIPLKEAKISLVNFTDTVFTKTNCKGLYTVSVDTKKYYHVNISHPYHFPMEFDIFTDTIRNIPIISQYNYQLQPFVFDGRVKNRNNRRSLDSARITLISDTANNGMVLLTDDDGYFSFKINPAQKYTIFINKSGFEEISSTINFKLEESGRRYNKAKYPSMECHAITPLKHRNASKLTIYLEPTD